jgi:hypothetical protein
MKANLCLFGALVVMGGVVWSERNLPSLMMGEQEREAKLDAQVKVALGRIDYRQKVVEDLIAGQISLANAAVKFEELNATYAGGTSAVLTSPEASEEEIRCRQVIFKVKATLKDRPCEASAVMERLEAELRKLLGGSPTSA